MRKVADVLSIDQVMAMSSLNTKQDKVVYLRDSGFNNDEIAFNLQTSVASVQSMLSRSKGQISTQRFQSNSIVDNVLAAANDEPVEPKKPFKLNVQKMNNMTFPTFQCFRTGTIIDKMMSDHTEEGGAYSGCVYVVPGESGAGKSTWLVDYIVKVQNFMNTEENQVARPVYVSGEMTKNDLYFYKAKLPGIGDVDTLLCNEYMRDGQLKDALEAIFRSPDYNIIVLDSYQDVVEKMTDGYGMKPSQAENWLITLMVEAAENHGKLIFAIQHMTKSGSYVGGTFLKHVTQGMIFVRKDKVNPSERYIEVSKNRRGGSMTDRPLYFFIKDGSVGYDTSRFDAESSAMNSVGLNADARAEQAANFMKIMDLHGAKMAGPTADELADEADAEQAAAEEHDFIATEVVGNMFERGNPNDISDAEEVSDAEQAALDELRQ